MSTKPLVDINPIGLSRRAPWNKRGYETGHRGGCHFCQPDGQALWTAANAQALAAKHFYATGHATWFESIKHVNYGGGEEG